MRYLILIEKLTKDRYDMVYGFVFSVGPTKLKDGRCFSVEDKIRITNRVIKEKGACLWGVNFKINTSTLYERVGPPPVNAYLYLTKKAAKHSMKVAYYTQVSRIDSQKNEHPPMEPELRPQEWKTLTYKTYLKFVKLITQMEKIKPIIQYSNEKGEPLSKYSARGYTAIQV